MCQIDIFYVTGFSMYTVVIYKKSMFNATIVPAANTYPTLALCSNKT